MSETKPTKENPQTWYRVSTWRLEIESAPVVKETTHQISQMETDWRGTTKLRTRAKHSDSGDWYSTYAEASARRREHAEKKLKQARNRLADAEMNMELLLKFEADDNAQAQQTPEPGQAVEVESADGDGQEANQPDRPQGSGMD